MLRIGGRIHWSSMVFLVAAACRWHGAEAQIRVHFDLPAQSLAKSLQAIGIATNTDVGFNATEVAGRTAPPLKAELTLDDALARVLAGTGLRPQHLNDHTVVIAAPGASPAGSAEKAVIPAKTPESAGPAQGSPIDNNPTDRSSPLSKDNQSAPNQLETVVVTGSHIRGVENKTDPVIVIDQAQIRQSGYSSTQELFQSLPQNYASGATTQAGFLGSGNNNFQFASGINLRGLGPSSTLVLLNGHRMAPAVVGTEVDVSSIPLAAIERVEILTDGTSAIYGSDAVGGVVNIITKTDYEGAETTARYGSVTAGSREEEIVAQTFGTRWSSGNVAGTIQYQNHSALNARDRSFADGLPSPSDLLPQDDTYSGTLTARQHLTDRVEVYTDVLWSKRRFGEYVSTTEAPPDGIDQEHNIGYSEDLNIASGVKYDFSPSWSAEVNGLYAKQHSRDAELLSGFFYPTSSEELLMSQFSEKSADVILNGKLFKTGGGDIAVAVGASYRDEIPEYRVDIDGVSALQTRPDRTVKAYYGEVYVPVVGPQNSRTLLQSLDFSAAVRTDRYSDFGSTTNPRFGTLWSPLAGLSFRASYGTSFRAPTESEVVQRLNTLVYIGSFESPSGTGEVPAIVSSVAKPLTAERAKSVNFGVEYRPADFKGADLTLNYYDIRYTDRIVQVFPPANVLQNPNIYGQLITSLPSDAAAQAYVDAAIAAGAVNYGDQTGTGMGITGVRYAFNAGIQNASIVRQSGLDFLGSLTGHFSAGNLSVQFNASFVDKIDTAYTAGAASANLVSTYGNPPKWRARLLAGWATTGWETSGAVSTVGGYVNTAGLGNPPVASWTTVDLSARLHIDHYLGGAVWRGVTVGASVLNVMDRNPPYINSSSVQTVNFDPSNASPLGRFVAVELRKKW